MPRLNHSPRLRLATAIAGVLLAGLWKSVV